MLEKALKGSHLYYAWLTLLLIVIGVGTLAFLHQYDRGLMVTGMSRDVTWGLYIAQLTFMVGVAASAVMLVLPYYLHDYKAFGRIAILGEFLAVPSIIVCMTIVLVDLGKPFRLLNIFLYPRPNSVLFWDVLVLSCYLLLNLVIGWTTLDAERKNAPPPKWVKPLIYLSIPWAISIHTVTAFLYAGLPGRGFWLTAILAPRFLASAFAAGPAILIMLSMLVRRITPFDPGDKAINMLSKIVTYAALLNLFFFLLEIFTAFYSQIPEHMIHFQYLFAGYHGKHALVPWMWTSYILAAIAIVMFVIPATRKNHKTLFAACLMIVVAIWIDKGMGLVAGGFIPNPLHEFTEYMPTLPEVLITVGVYGIGLLILTVLYKIAISVKVDQRA